MWLLVLAAVFAAACITAAVLTPGGEDA